jgi:predicted GNAT family acetyltransferase
MAELRQIAEAVEAEKRGVLSNDRRAALQEIRNRAAGSKKTLINYIEPLLTIGSAAISEPVSGFVGMAGLPFGVDAASSAIKRTQDAMTYQPRTQGGKEVMQDIGNLIAPVVEPLQRGAEWMGDTTLDVTGSPALATAVRTGLEVAPDMVGGKILSKIPGRKLEAGDLAASGGQMGRQRGAVAGAEANSLSSLWKDRGIKSSVSERSDSIILNQMVVPKSNRGRGAGTQAMQELIDYADSIGKRVDLSPSADFGGNKNRLT